MTTSKIKITTSDSDGKLVTTEYEATPERLDALRRFFLKLEEQKERIEEKIRNRYGI